MLFIAGVVVGAFGVFAVMAALARLGDRVNDLRDDASETLFVGGGADFIQHTQPTTHRERNDHA